VGRRCRANLSLSIGGGPAVGWFPLAPREVYVPAYRVSPRYVRDVNYTHVRNIPNVNVIIGNPDGMQRDYANRKYPHAVTVVPANVLSNREPVGPSAARTRDLPAVRAIVNEPAGSSRCRRRPRVPPRRRVAARHRGASIPAVRRRGAAGPLRPTARRGRDDARRAPNMQVQPVPPAVADRPARCWRSRRVPAPALPGDGAAAAARR
jgi:hypothetical protein